MFHLLGKLKKHSSITLLKLKKKKSRFHRIVIHLSLHAIYLTPPNLDNHFAKEIILKGLDLFVNNAWNHYVVHMSLRWIKSIIRIILLVAIVPPSLVLRTLITNTKETYTVISIILRDLRLPVLAVPCPF
jgi:hypothetical protein